MCTDPDFLRYFRPAPDVTPQRDAQWISWTPRGRDPYTNPRSSVAHAADGLAGNVTNGGFPLLCGRWAPDGFDAVIAADRGRRRCRRCERALANKGR